MKLNQPEQRGVRVSISLPKELKDQMDKIPFANWSSIARGAFRSYVQAANDGNTDDAEYLQHQFFNQNEVQILLCHVNKLIDKKIKEVITLKQF